MTSVLSARGISVSFGGVHAVVEVDLDVEPDQLVGLIGPNGAGKTTFIDAVTGFVPHRGTVSIDGRDVTGSKPHVRALRGLARTWQATELFDDLTVRENLTVAARHPTTLETIKELFSSQVSDVEAVDEALEWLSLGELGYGHQKSKRLPPNVGIRSASVRWFWGKDSDHWYEGEPVQQAPYRFMPAGFEDSGIHQS